MKKALVVGGGNGIGLAISLKLLENGYDHIYIVGKDIAETKDIPENKKAEFNAKTSFQKVNLTQGEYQVFDNIKDIDTLIITAGFGRVAPFEELTDWEIDNLIKCNELAVIQIIKKYYEKIKAQEKFYCAVMGSIAGYICSPLFSVYSAAKSGVCRFIENINAELAHNGYQNRILNVSPGSLKGTKFNGGQNSLETLNEIVNEIISRMSNSEMLFIPQYEEVYKGVINRAQENPIKFGKESYEYKVSSGRISYKRQGIVGYLSGTFDLFHIGHLNLLRRAKEQCDYLIVGVHKSGAWKGKETYISFEERKEIVGSIKYVDQVVESYLEDSQAYDNLKFDKLFVGSDYKGTERFLRYEEYFKDKGVEIIYFPYTNSTSSTQLRAAISKNIEGNA